MAITYDPIATTTLGTATSSITFSSIAGTYTDLRLVWAGSWNTSSDRFCVRFNGDTGSNYGYTNLYGDGSSVASGRGNNVFIVANQTSRAQGLMSMNALDIFSYAGSTFKTVLLDSPFDENGAGYMIKQVACWRSTAAITSVTMLTLNGNNFAIGTTATLYGIKAA